MAAPKIPNVEVVTNQVMNKLTTDPLTVLAGADNFGKISMDLLPVLPWEFPIPVPRIIYERLNLANMVEMWRIQQ